MGSSLGYLGPPGTHSEAAAIFLTERLHLEAKLVPFTGIYDAIDGVRNGKVAWAVVPVENSLEGSVNITLDTLARMDSLYVSCELIWPVHHWLLAKRKDITPKRIYSHPQALAQCREFLTKNYANAEVCPTPSTASAAEKVATGGCEDIAAISTPRAGEIYSLLAIAKDIEDSSCNETRFFLISATPQNNIVTDKALVICQMDGSRPGSLLAVLSEFAQRGINLTRIESRPAKTGLGAYIFFFDLEVPTISEGLTECLAAVKERSFWLKDLGRFPVIRN